MLTDQESRDHHERFHELCALAGSGSLAPLEVSELQIHLRDCEECREVFLQYRALATQGMTALADAFVERQERASWDDASTRLRLLARIRADRQVALDGGSPKLVAVRPHLLRRVATNSFAQLAFAACLLLAVSFGAYLLDTRTPSLTVANLPPVSSSDRFQKFSDEKRQADELLEGQAKKLTLLEKQSSEKEQELAKLRLALRTLEDRSNALMATNNQSGEQLQALLRQQDTLNAQLQATTQAYEKDRAELASLRAERDKTFLRTASLEARIEELTAKNRDQERRLKDAEQYLSSDRDIRELMGARKLYIADVFDVDGSSRTRKPFGRVFYTQGKSLIFYAFDLDREPGVVNASTFQVWGQREASQGEQTLPMNLGILYMDSELNRRWVMRFDDPKQLAEIDAVFVTVEPHGGSHKPTAKPFLYALLRNEVNHP